VDSLSFFFLPLSVIPIMTRCQLLV
jgi:hypothetical protein